MSEYSLQSEQEIWDEVAASPPRESMSRERVNERASLAVARFLADLNCEAWHSEELDEGEQL